MDWALSQNRALVLKYQPAGIGSNARPLMDNLRNSRHRNMEIQRQPIHADGERLHEILVKNFSRMNGRQFSKLSHAPSW
jgi:hypothetical protein